MAVFKFSLDDEHSRKLEAMARKEGVSVQDFIRKKLFDLKTIFTPAEAVERALKKYKKGELFTLPNLYGDEWTLQRGTAGYFGKQFYTYVIDECQGIIEFDGMINNGRHAQYRIV